MPRSVAGITASSSQQALLQTIYNLPLSLDKVSLWGAFSIGRTVCLYQKLVRVDGFWSGQRVNDTQLILPPTSHPESIN